MKTRIGLFIAIAALAASAVQAADVSPFAGKWFTNAFADAEAPKKQGALSKAIAGAVNGGSTQSSIGNSQQQSAPEPGLGTFHGQEAEPPIGLEIKIDDKGKVSIVVNEVTVRPSYSIKKPKVEEPSVTAQKVEFLTTEKSEKVSNTIRWVGELSDPETLKVTRQTKAGNPIDDGPIVFHRGR